MVVKKSPSSLHDLSLESLCQGMLQQWKNTYYTNYLEYSEHFINDIGVLIPIKFYDKIFEVMVESHARFVQNEKIFIPSISALVNSIISPNLRILNLDGLRHIGIVQDEEIGFLHDMLVYKLPYFNKLKEISLLTSGIDSTLPISSDEILKEIGSACSRLTNLDVSYNHTVTDKGLWSLIPSTKQNGCPNLVKVSLFECSVTNKGIVVLLKGLPKLKFLGYKETGESLQILHRRTSSSTPMQPLQLAHCNNLGTLNRTCKSVDRLGCKSALVSAILKLCPKLNALKVRVNDSAVKLLHEITTVSILELVYNLGVACSPGNNTVQYLQLSGAQFVSLSFVCDRFSTRYLKIICEFCNNLKCLSLKSKNFDCDEEITVSDKEKCLLTNLEEFSFRVGFDVFYDLCEIPVNVLNYILHKSDNLKEIALIMRNTLLTDSYIEDSFSSIETSKIKKVKIEFPCCVEDFIIPRSMDLTMLTVETLIGICPELEELGRLPFWDLSLEDIEGLRRQLQLTNSALIIQ